MIFGFIMNFFSFKKISGESGSLQKKLDSFGLEASKDLEAVMVAMMEAVMEALMEAMEVTKALARELGRAGSSSKKN